MDEQAEQLVLDYLRRAGDAAYGTLRTDQRLDFVRRLRARIEEFRASSGARDAEQMRKVLDRFGDPVALVRREQKRLAQEAADRAAAAESAADTAGAQQAGQSAAGQPAERPHEEGQSRSVSTTEDLSGEGSQSTGQRAEESVRPKAGAEGETAREEEPTTEPIPVVRATGGQQAAPRPGAARHRSGRNLPQARPQHTGPPLYQPRSPREAGQTVPSAVSGLVDRLPPPVRDTLRGGVLEGIGLVLVGMGGALAPLPLWFIGVLVVSLAAGWSLPDKLVGLFPPPVLAVIGPAVFAVLGYGSGGHSYLLELRNHGWTLFRVGAVVGAVYLAAVLLDKLRKNRSSTPPWKQRNRR